MRCTFIFLAILALIAQALAFQTMMIGGKEVKISGVPLFDYAGTRDPNYSWRETGEVISGDGWTGTLLNLTSQQWLTPKDTSQSIWMHQLLIIRPDYVQTEEIGALYITGGDNHMTPLKNTDIDVLIPAILAVSANVTSAALLQVPNQPISFAEDYNASSRQEDSLVAYTWMQYVKNPSRPDWVAYFPMVKAAVAAMDAMTEYSAQQVQAGKWSKEISQFYISGASKRGATTWLTAAFEGSKPANQRRLLGAAPIVYDALNFTTTVPRMFELYGAWSFAFEPYQRSNVTTLIGTPGMDILASAIDPMYPPYAAALANIEKLVVTTAGDEFFVIDNDHFWWNDLQGPKYRYIAPNAEHATITGITGVLTSISGHLNAIIQKRSRPTINWSFSASGTLTVQSDQQPKKVKVYRAVTINSKPNRRDFRLIKANVEGGCLSPAIPISAKMCLNPVLWADKPIEGDYDAKSQVFTYSYTENVDPEFDSWVGFFLMLEYPSGEKYTTQVFILPDRLPFAPCGSGPACYGTLV